MAEYIYIYIYLLLQLRVLHHHTLEQGIILLVKSITALVSIQTEALSIVPRQVIMVKQIPMCGSVLITHTRYVERIQHRNWLARVAIQERRLLYGIEPVLMPRLCEAHCRCMEAIGAMPRGVEDVAMQDAITSVLDSCHPGELENDPHWHL